MTSPDTRRVLIVEDEYFLASDLSEAVENRGWEVAGPVSTVEAAFDLVRSRDISEAILDINLGGEMVYALADELTRRSIRFVFSTGYDDDDIPDRFKSAPRCTKPCVAADVVALL